MSAISEKVLQEVRETVVSTLGLSSSVIVAKATKFIRFDWQRLLEYFEKSLPGINPPWVLIRPSPTIDDNWGASIQAKLLPIEIFYIDSLRNTISTTTTTTGTGTVKVFASTTGMFVGQRLWFPSSSAYGIIASVDSGTQITLSSSIATTSGDSVKSDLSCDVEVKVEMLRYAFRLGQVFTNFQIVDAPETDISDQNPANEYMEENNYSLLAGSCFIQPLFGESL